MNIRKRFSILKRIHRAEQIETSADYEAIGAKLKDLVDRGIIEALHAKKHYSSMSGEIWFRDKRRGVVYRLVPPDFPSVGRWAEVENPDQPSFFENLHDDIYFQSRQQFDDLVRKLDEAWSRGEIEHGLDPSFRAPCVGSCFYHPASDEAYGLIFEPRALDPSAAWMKLHKSKKNGTWPGDIVLSPPPWRDHTGNVP